MTFLPVVAREMLALSRRKGTYRLRVVMAMIAIGVMAYLLMLSFSALSYAQQGRSVFAVLSSLSFAYCLIAGLIATSDCVSEEKREGTLGLLFLTNLKAYDIVLGKLAASSLNTMYSLMAIVPMLSTTLLLGGVSLVEVGMQALALGTSMFLSLATGVLISAIFKNERKALLASVLTLSFIVFGPYLFALWLSGMNHAPEELVWPSPLYSFLAVLMGSTGGVKDAFIWVSLIWQHSLAWILLYIASRILPGTVNELSKRKFVKLQLWFHQIVFGNASIRKKYRAKLLDRNPFLWLASRERVKKNYAWMVIAFFGALYGWMYSDKSLILDLMVTGVILFLTHFIFKIWLTSEVCSRLLEDKRSGALELLLSSPLSVREIAHGQHLALRRIFGAPILFLVTAELFVLYLTLQMGRAGQTEVWVFFSAAIFTLLLDLWALKWAGLWNSLFGKSIERVLMSVMVKILGIPWMIFVVLALMTQALARGFGLKIPDWWMVAGWAGIGLLFSGVIGLSSRIKFLTHFRSAASHVFNAKGDSKGELETSLAVSMRNSLLRTRSRTVARLVPSIAWKHPFATIACLALFMAVVAIGARQLYWRSQLEARVAKIQKQGEPTSVKEIGKYLTPVANDQNGYAVLRNAGLVNMMNLPYNTLSRLWNGKLKSGRDTLEGSLSGIIYNNREILSAIRSLTNYPRAYRVVELGDARQRFSLYPYPYLLQAELAVALGLTGEVRALTDGEKERVVADLLATLAFAQLLRQVPEMDGQWSCAMAVNVFRQAYQEACLRMEFEEKTLMEFQRRLGNLEKKDFFPRIVAVNRAKIIELETYDFHSNGGGQPVAVAFVNFLSRMSGTRSKVFCYFLNGVDEMIELNKTDFAPALEYAALLSKVNIDLTQYLGAVGWSSVNAVAPLQHVAQQEATVRMQATILRAAIAAELYKRHKGEMPRGLAELVPQYLNEMPMDLFAPGNQLSYKVVSDEEFSIYSVGRPGLATADFLIFESMKQEN